MAKKIAKILVKFYPRCKGEVIMVTGGGIGLHECKKCGFRASLFPEKEIKIGKIKNG